MDSEDDGEYGRKKTVRKKKAHRVAKFATDQAYGYWNQPPMVPITPIGPVMGYQAPPNVYIPPPPASAVPNVEEVPNTRFLSPPSSYPAQTQPNQVHVMEDPQNFFSPPLQNEGINPNFRNSQHGYQDSKSEFSGIVPKVYNIIRRGNLPSIQYHDGIVEVIKVTHPYS